MTSEKNDEPEKIDHVPDDVGVVIPPDGGYAWVVLVAAFLISFTIDGCMYSLGILLPDIREYYGATQDQANLVISLNTGLLFLCGPTVAGLSNKFGIRTVIMVGSICGALTFYLSTLSPNIFVMMVLFGVFAGLFMGSVYIPSLWGVSMYFSKKRGIATGITMAGSGVGAFAFAPFTEYLLKTFGWKVTLIILAAIILQCCWCGALIKPLKPTKRPKQSVELGNLKSDKNEVQQIASSALSLKEAGINEEDFSRPMYKKDAVYTGSVKNLQEFKAHHENEEEFARDNISIKLKENCCQRNPAFKVLIDIVKEMTDFKLLGQNKQFLLVTLANFFMFAGFFVPYIYIPIYAKELEIKNYPLIMSIIGITNIPARILFGIVADRKIISAFNLNTFSYILMMAMNFVMFALRTFELQIIFSVVFGIGVAGLNSLTTLYLVDIVGLDKLTNANGIVFMFRGIGCLLGPFIAGFVTEIVRSTVSAFFFSAVLFMIAVIIVMLMTIINICRRCCSKSKNKKEEILKADDKDVDKSLLNKV